MHTALDGTEFLIENGLGVAQKAEPAPHSTTQQRYAMVVVVVVVECCFTATETVGLLGTGAQDVHLDFHRWWWWWLKAFIWCSSLPLSRLTALLLRVILNA